MWCPVAEEEGEIMAARQQPLRFSIDEDELDEEEVSWGDDDEDGNVDWVDEPASAAEEEWETDDADEEEEWQAEDEEDEPLSWDASPPRPPHAARSSAADLDEELDIEGDDEPARANPVASIRRRLAGPAVLSLAACLALVWAANQMPDPDDSERRGRDAVMFAEPLSSKPSQIMRLATTAEAADADAHVHSWKAQPPRPVVARKPEAEPAAVAAAAPREPAKGSATTAAASAAAQAAGVESFVGPMPERPAEIEVSAPAAKPQPVEKKDSVASSVTSKPATKPAKATATASTRHKGPVYTVQLGAFKARRNAEDMVTRLRGKSPRILQEGGLYRVMSGAFASKKDAVLHEASLRRAGYTTYVRTAVF
jgi:cell division septation protein DedD